MRSFKHNNTVYNYEDRTTFMVEVGRFDNEYKINKLFHHWQEASEYYDEFIVSNGYKKRLSMMTDGHRTTIDRQLTA